jgi:hypothetical protein
VRQPQLIPWFSLLWIGAVHDHARWRDDARLVRSLLPGVRAALEAFLARRSPEGVAATPEGWNDTEGTREPGVSALTNWLLAPLHRVTTLRSAPGVRGGGLFLPDWPRARW